VVSKAESICFEYARGPVKESEDEDSADEILPVALESRPSLAAVLLTSSTVILGLATDLGSRFWIRETRPTRRATSSYKGKIKNSETRSWPSITPFVADTLCFSLRLHLQVSPRGSTGAMRKVLSVELALGVWAIYRLDCDQSRVPHGLLCLVSSILF
jgi:hypothetical protein